MNKASKGKRKSTIQELEYELEISKQPIQARLVNKGNAKRSMDPAIAVRLRSRKSIPRESQLFLVS